MRFLPHRNLHNPEIQDNFAEVEVALSELVMADVVTQTEVEGTKAKKIAVKDSRGRIVGYLALYAK